MGTFFRSSKFFSCHSSLRPFSLSTIFFTFPHLFLELFCFLYIRLLICLYAFSTHLSVEFPFVILKDPVLLVQLDSHPVSSKSLVLHQHFWIYFFQLYCQSCLLMSFLSSIVFHCVLVYFSFLGTFACSRRFFICSSSLIFQPSFQFLFGFFRGIPILSLTSFDLA